MPCQKPLRIRWTRRVAANARLQEGSALVELSLVVPLVLYLICGAVDYGRAYSIGIELSSAAEAGALYGMNHPYDTSGIQSAAQSGAPGVGSVITSASYGCECADGSGVSPSCSTVPTCSGNYVNYVTVTATTNYKALVKYPGLRSEMSISGQANVRVGGN